MQLQLIDGRFPAQEAEVLLTELIEAKMRHHARRIEKHAGSEEDIKASETRLKQLQDELRQVRQFFRTLDADARVDIESPINVVTA